MSNLINFFFLACRRKLVFLLILSIPLITGCSKQETADEVTPEKSKELRDVPRSLAYNRSEGKLTIEYKSGKKLIKDIPADSVAARNLVPFHAADEWIYDGDEFIDPDVLPEDQFYAPKAVINVECLLHREEAGGLIYAVTNYAAYPAEPIVFYEKPNPQWPGGPFINVKRQTQILGVYGSAAPLPGLPVTVTWRYTINYIYTYSGGGGVSGVRTRQYNATTVRVYY